MLDQNGNQPHAQEGAVEKEAARVAPLEQVVAVASQTANISTLLCSVDKEIPFLTEQANEMS